MSHSSFYVDVPTGDEEENEEEEDNKETCGVTNEPSGKDSVENATGGATSENPKELDLHLTNLSLNEPGSLMSPEQGVIGQPLPGGSAMRPPDGTSMTLPARSHPSMLHGKGPQASLSMAGEYHHILQVQGIGWFS